MRRPKRRRYRSLDEFFEDTGKTQTWLADVLDVDPSYISMIRSGKRQPALDLSLRIEALTGVRVESLVMPEMQS